MIGEEEVWPGAGNCALCGHPEHNEGVCGVIVGGTFEPDYCDCIDAFAIDALIRHIKGERDAALEAIYAMDREIGTWLSDYAPGQSWLRALKVAYGPMPGSPTEDDIAADANAPHPRVHPKHGCAESVTARRLAVEEALDTDHLLTALRRIEWGNVTNNLDLLWVAINLSATLREEVQR